MDGRSCSSHSSQSASSTKSNASNADKSKQQDVAAASIKFHRSSWGKRRDSNNSRDRKFLPSSHNKNFAASNFYDKFYEKQPRARGSGSGSLQEPFNEFCGEVISAQKDSLNANKKVYGSKKHNLNHLLNFSFASREQVQHDYSRGQSHAKVARHSKYNKEQFLQANCQFIVKEGHDYSVHVVDPDISVDWNLVEEIRFNSLGGSETVCPICLHSPVAAKITRCGHIFCWSCILHYLSLSDRQWRKCPICFDVLRGEDLRSVSSVPQYEYKVGDEISLCLMRRKKGSTIITPLSSPSISSPSISSLEVSFSSIPLTPDDALTFDELDAIPSITCHQKIIVASAEHVLKSITSRERNQLEKQMIEDRDTPEVCFIESALQLLKQREDSLSRDCGTNDDNGDNLNANQSVINQSAVSTDKESGSGDDDFYHFYQSEDGQHIYLHALNVRMLRQEYGGLSQCPLRIRAKIIEMEWFSMTDQLRKRLRYMQHLPLTCEFRIVELLICPPLVSQPTLDSFQEDVNRRQRTRNRREREERRRDHFIQVEENKRIFGIYPLPKYQLNSNKQFPACQEMDALRSTSPTESESMEDLLSTVADIKDDISISSGTSPPSAEPEFASMSFATMLREGKAKPSVDINLPVSRQVLNNDEEEYQAPKNHYYLSDAFAVALQLKASNEQNDHHDDRKGKKKKKNKPKVLLSTSMKRSY